MKYSSGLVWKPFLFLESKKTAHYILERNNRKKIVEIAIKKNIYQVKTDNRSKTIANICVTRLNSLPKIIVKDILSKDVKTSKILVLISIMKTDKLFFEFMYEVFRNKVIIGEKFIDKKDLNIFFDNKMIQSDIVASWAESTIQHLKKDYIRVLKNADIVQPEDDKNKIVIPLIDYNVECDIKNNNLSSYLNAITGQD
ncbi:MAG: putative protein [Methanobrevibacter sp. CfCl-M3]